MGITGTIDACRIDCGGDLVTRQGILGKERATLRVGGTIHAQYGVSAVQIGTERGPRTEIHCGIDFKAEQKLIWIRDRNIALAFELREIENRMKASPSTLDRNEDADVPVREMVYPGTYIEICHVSCFITRPKRFLTFKLDKATGRIVEKKWEKRAGKPKAPPAGA